MLNWSAVVSKTGSMEIASLDLFNLFKDYGVIAANDEKRDEIITFLKTQDDLCQLSFTRDQVYLYDEYAICKGEDPLPSLILNNGEVGSIAHRKGLANAMMELENWCDNNCKDEPLR